ncbi:hypothetical protein B296_00009990 [Ensete ventricosum]|uniref:Uncharacterized protein n=1 Tax=Ensete ventricosum TaxID=4639 RepID=A0A427AQG9_ENSVE|nr:hypothetical protein B296_00009990 [Ensete ventricosum]
MVGVLSLSYIEGDMGLVGFSKAFLHNSPHVSLSSQRVVPFGCWAPDDDIDLLLNEPLRSGGWVSGPPNSTRGTHGE